LFSGLQGGGGQVTVHKGYDVLRKHAYTFVESTRWRITVPLVSLPPFKILALRALCRSGHHEGGGRLGMMRLSLRQRPLLVWPHVLENLKVFQGGEMRPRVSGQRFFRITTLIVSMPRSDPRRGTLSDGREEYKVPSQRGSEDPYYALSRWVLTRPRSWC
jgi:hypothetical protein